MSQATPLIEVQELNKRFDVSKGFLQRTLAGEPKRYLQAVADVSFTIQKGQTFSVVGESGCGKSTVAKLVVGLYPPSSGAIKLEGTDLTQIKSRSAMAQHRRRMQMIFQDPYASLNPRWRVRDIIMEPLKAFDIGKDNAERRALAAQLLEQVGLSGADGVKYPHEFSGGQRQRISIARALANKPEFIVCDEPTSALDVSVQAQILNLMKDLQRNLGLTYLFISHNLAVVDHVSDTIAVMYLGRLCEVAPAKTLFQHPKHPYSRMLLDTIPDLAMSGRERTPVRGEVPSPIDPPKGCAFHPRCPLANARCKTERPALAQDGASQVACHAVAEGRA